MKAIFLAVAEFLSLVHLVAAAPFAKNVINVDLQCGILSAVPATVKVTTDNKVEAILTCKNNAETRLVSTEENVYTAKVGYFEGQACVFKQDKIPIQEFLVVLRIAIRGLNESGLAIQKYDYRYILSCNWDSYGNDLSPTETIDTSRQRKVGVSSFKGGNIQSPLSLRLEDVMGNAITSEIPVGKSVRLHAEITSSTFSEQAIRGFECVASNAGSKYNLLVGGCGDGIIMSKTDGFLTEGRHVYSPFFSAFRLQGSTRLLFDCVFVSCSTLQGCNGDSCSNAP